MGSIPVDKRAWDESKFFICYGSVGRRKILDGKCCNKAAAGTNVHLESYRAFQNGKSKF